MLRKLLILAMAVLVVGLAILARDQAQAGGGFQISILSSSPDEVSGGDALVRVDVPKKVPLQQVTVELNGVDVTGAFEPEAEDKALIGLVDGFVLGENTLEATATSRGKGRPASAVLTVTNHPITGPIFSGPQQQPFVCKTERGGLAALGQPLVDNDDPENPIGFPVYAVDDNGNKTDEVIGWSKDCSAETRVDYVYRTTGGEFEPLPPGDPPDDLAQTTLMDDRTVDYVVRWERGTINRFIYSIAMLAPLGEDPEQPDRSAWNGRLVFSFQGGVGIGHSQGDPDTDDMLRDDVLSLGYAVAYTTGNIAGVHYNLQVGGETALMVKERFVERHGVPYYTVSIGGSGGAIQQYVYGQNHPGLLDAAIPQRSYPDMVTQTIHIGDCELLEFYMDVTDGGNWQNWENRTWLEGLNASNTVFNPYTGSLGNSECINGWRGLSPLAMNPHYGSAGAGQELMQPPGVMAEVKWTHFDDLRNIYGVDDDGYARVTWDNVGVQYGLQALIDDNITPAEFLHINANVGGWKQTKDMIQEVCPFYPYPTCTFGELDPWSARNMNLSPDGGITPAPRTEGSIEAMNAAYESGMVFDGKIDIPIIDGRDYLEDFLDMHNTHQSFASRQRMIEGQGSADNQVIWFSDVPPAFDLTAAAFRVIDEWMENIKDNPDKSVAENKPADAVDRCFDNLGGEIARGDDVWDGILNDEPAGACTQEFQIYSTSRIVAGGPLKGGIFKCQLQSLGKAIAKGVYGSWEPDRDQRARLKAIFPTGVCDYSRPDAGRP